MCGINGFNWQDESLIKKMNKKIKHRGPDDEGYFTDKMVSLGHVRLSIIDLTATGHQPMENEDGSIKIVFNGEIYNFMAIRKILEKRGHVFKSHTDTEVIIHSYEEWGESCIKRFNGMWAFAIYDAKKSRLFLSRDRFGIKPLYYYTSGGKFVFSSEMKGIFEHGIKKVPNDALIYDFLVYDLIDHTEETFFKGIKKLMPGHNLIYDLKKRSCHIQQYYDLNKRIRKTEDERFRELFFKSVRRRLIADVPVGSCLSGGLDSSSIVCAMREIEKDKEIHTFSLIFPGNKVDESRYQKIVVNKTGVMWHKTTFGGRDILKDMEDLIHTQEEPFRTLSIYGQYRVMKLTKKNNIKVILDGQGSDEILAGYHWFFGYYFAELIRMGKLMTAIKEMRSYKKIYGSMSPVKYTLSVFLQKMSVATLRMRNSYLNARFLKGFRKRNAKAPLLNVKTVNEIAVLAETYFSLPYLLRLEDKNSMRWSVESRVPFCDHELVEHVCSLPRNEKINNSWTKVVLRDSLRGLLPDEIRLRRDKVGFATPDDDLLRSNEGRKLAYSIIDSESFRSRKYWDWGEVKKMLDEHLRKKKNHGKVLWKILIIEMWLRIWCDLEEKNEDIVHSI